MQLPLVSILTPFKNTADYLDECLRSIRDQSYTHWELIIIDDHSEDNSLDVVNHHAQQDERIKVYQNSGNGIIEALRMAFELSTGDFITRMDSDDVMHPDKLKQMVFDLQQHGTNHIALGLVEYFSKTGISDGYAKYQDWLNRLTRQGNNYSEIYKECVIASPCWMIHREDLIRCKAFEPNIYPEDYDLTFRFLKYGIHCIPSNNLLHYWRDYSSRTSRTHSHYAENSFLELKVDYFLELHYDGDRPLTIWGAGQKGKRVAQLLQLANVPFYWICDNPKKIGKDIYNEPMRKFNFLDTLQNPQSIVTVANENSQAEIRDYFDRQQMASMIDYFFFC